VGFVQGLERGHFPQGLVQFRIRASGQHSGLQITGLVLDPDQMPDPLARFRREDVLDLS
jgi:hypothetical protein